MKTKKHWIPWMILIGVFAVLYGGLQMLIPAHIGRTLDQSNQQVIEKAIVLLLLFYLGIWMSETIANTALAKLATQEAYRLRERIEHKIQYVRCSYLDHHTLGDVLNTINTDVENVARGITQTVFKVLSGITTILGATILMWQINVTLAILLIASAPCMYLISQKITTKTNQFFQKRASKISQISEYADEMIAGYQMVKNNAYEEKALHQFDQYNDQLYQVSFKAQFYSALSNPGARLVTNLAYVILGIVGTILLQKQMLTIGDMSTFLIYVSVYTKPFHEITSLITEMQMAYVSYKRIRTFEKETEEPIENLPEPVPILQGDIQFKQVNFSYEKGKPIIQNFNLIIPEKKKIAIVGKTGSGKTTLASLLLRFYPIETGKITIGGQDIQQIPLGILRKNIGIVLQDTHLFAGTIRENIVYGKEDVTEEEFQKIVQLTQLDSFVKHLEKDYDTVVSQDNLLSEGEVQLINIARILLVKPPYVILDEATSNIDLLTEEKVQKAMEQITQNSTAIVIAHRLSTIQTADQVIYLEQGHLVEQGTHQALLEKRGRYAKLYESQYGIE